MVLNLDGLANLLTCHCYYTYIHCKFLMVTRQCIVPHGVTCVNGTRQALYSAELRY